MTILLASHNFLPYNTGGTEIYVLNFAKFLIDKGHRLTIIASIGSKNVNEDEIVYQDDHLKICSYLYDKINVFGVQYNKTTTEQIYSKKSAPYQNSYELFFNSMHFDLLHVNGFTATIGLDLIYALKQNLPNIKIVTSFHTVISDPKETFTFANTLTEQKGKINPVADVLSYRFNIPYSITKFLSKLLPSAYFDSLPAIFSIKYLVNQHVKSFNLLKQLTNEWWVYSVGIRNHLIANGVATSKIKVARHGVSTLFIDKKNIARLPYKFLFSGRIEKIKGFHILVEAWLSTPDDDGKQLWITADPHSDEKSIQAIIKKCKGRKDIKWLGSLSQEQLAATYLIVHTVIIPSVCYETGPLVFHEAIGSGCAVIASNIGGCKELSIFYGNEKGIFKAGNSKQLKEKILEFTNNHQAVEPIKVLNFNNHFFNIMDKSTVYLSSLNDSK